MRGGPATLLLILAVTFGATSIHARDPIPREWTELPFDSIDPHPWEWARSGTCIAAGSTDQVCVIDLYSRSGQPQGSARLNVYWLERSPSDCPTKLETWCRESTVPPAPASYEVGTSSYSFESLPESRFLRYSPGQAAMVAVHWTTKIKSIDPTHAEALLRIVDEVAETIGFYAQPCSCDGVQVGPVAPIPSLPTSAPPATQPPSPPTAHGNPDWHVPNSGEGNPDQIEGTEDPVIIAGQGDPFGQGEPTRTGAFVREPSAIPIPGARITALRYFESAVDPQPIGERTHLGTFSARSTRYVFWELTLVHPPVPRPTRVKIDEVWYRPDGSVFAKQSSTHRVEQGWNDSILASGRGWDEPGGFRPGTWTLRLHIDGEPIIDGSFDVVGGP